jgi:hypothetical protein
MEQQLAPLMLRVRQIPETSPAQTLPEDTAIVSKLSTIAFFKDVVSSTFIIILRYRPTTYTVDKA